MRHRPHMRPEFTVPLSADGQIILDRIQQRLRDDEVALEGQVVAGHAMLMLPRTRRSLLSPVLDLDVIEVAGRAVLRGRFSPQPNVWTGFLAVYGVLGCVAVAGLMYGFAQLTVDESPWALLATPVALVLMAFVYGAAFIGQGLTGGDMYEMRSFVDGVVGERPEGPAAQAIVT